MLHKAARFSRSCFSKRSLFFTPGKKFAAAFVVALKSANNSFVVISAFRSVYDLTLFIIASACKCSTYP